ncbi:MAG: NAD(P)/FAD-dependent oxidoreductase [Maricaulaceae bacterium]
MTIAVIGAGLAGSACAHRLAHAGQTVTVFDKGRGPGGRASTRRMNIAGADWRFDHGAQYATAQDERFAAFLSDAQAAGLADRWLGRFGAAEASAIRETANPTQRWVGTPGMNGLVKFAQRDLDVRFGVRITTISPQRVLTDETGAVHGPFDAVICATPAEQAGDLLDPSAPGLAAQARAAKTLANWTVMVAFAEPIDVSFDGVKFETGPLGWVARNNSKPARDPGEAWVLQAAPGWSQTHVEDPAETVSATLMTVFADRIGSPPPPLSVSVHRWRYAFVDQPANSPAGWDARARIAVCGDWRIGPRLEAAFLSGLAAAERVLGRDLAG